MRAQHGPESYADEYTWASLPGLAARGTGSFLMHYARRHPGSHILIFASVLAAVCCAIGAQYGVKNLVDVLGAGATTEPELWSAVVLLLALVAGDNLFWRLAGWVAARSFVAVAGDVRGDLFQHLTRHGTRYFANRFPGALAGRIATAGNAAFAMENRLAWNTIPPAAAVLSSIAVLGVVNWRLTVALALIAVVLGSIIAWLAGRSSYLHDRFADRAAAVTGDLADVISNMGLVRAFAAAHRERERLSHSIGHEMAAQGDSLRALERIRLLHAVSVFLVTAAVVVWSVLLWRAGRITTGDVVLATTLGFTVLHASRDLAMAMVDLLIDGAKLRDAVRSLCIPHEMGDAPGARQLIPLGGSVSFLGVCFSYPDGERVLQDFTLHIPAGQKVGLVGRSGAGKSTILAMLQRLYDPERGQVLIDEQDIAGVAQDSLRRAIAVVHQDISLFHRSILENLRYGRPEASDNDVYAAAEAAHCTEFIRQLPDGFDTIVGERGLKLSGGQRQRLAIARAFLCNAPIILLDEATSALDAGSEQLIQDALARLFGGRTVIAATHRLSTLASFDRIIVLEHKHVLEDASVAQLLRSYGTLGWAHFRSVTAGNRA